MGSTAIWKVGFEQIILRPTPVAGLDWAGTSSFLDGKATTALMYDAIVLGIGGIGSAALYELARRGVRALGIDRFRPPHTRGSTHGQTRVIRQAYFEHSDYVPLLLESYRLWKELEDFTSRRLYHEVGLVEVGPHDGIVVPGVIRAAAAHGLSIDRLTATELTDTWPGLRAARDMQAVFERHAGYLLVEDCVDAHLVAAQAAGAQVLMDTEVVSWSANEREVRVVTSSDTIIAERLVIAAGPWAEQVLACRSVGETMLDRGLRFEVRRKSLFWLQCDAPEYDARNGMPVFLFELPAGVFYGFPKLDAQGIKVAEHTGGRVVADPLNVDRDVDPGEQQRIVDFLAVHLPGVSRRVTRHEVCLYTMSPDEHFIIDRHPQHPNVAFAAGLSGHGFKFAPVLGAALADLALNGRSNLPIAFLSADRLIRPAQY